MAAEQTSCNRCGNCCEKGGPALHLQDLELIRSGTIPISSLITVRKGELVHNPVTGKVQPASVEVVKLVGTGRTWNCCYYDSQAGCTIYNNRPHACKLLKCWDNEALLAVVEKDTLDRLAILETDHPMVPIIQEHEGVCPCIGIGEVYDKRGNLLEKQKQEIGRLVREDLRFRQRIIRDFDLKLSEELFFFGRPFFQLLQPLGVRISEVDGQLQVNW